MKKGVNDVLKCDNCRKEFVRKSNLNEHVKEDHKKCTLCDRTFPNEKPLETHEIAAHKKSKSKHIIEKDPSLRNHINKKFM